MQKKNSRFPLYYLGLRVIFHNIVYISYHCHMVLILFLASQSEIHPSHKSSICTLGISRLHRAFNAGYGIVFVTGHLSVHSLIILPPLSLSNIYERRKHYRKKFIYSDEQAPQCPGQDYLYIQSRQTGKFICRL